MFLELLSHEYFWLSFLPISLLGTGFWLLFIERQRDQKDAFGLLLLALLAGILSAIFFTGFNKFWIESSWFMRIVGEESIKFVFALLAMEVFRRKFKSLAGGIVYGFAIGLGFALAENLVYLKEQYEISRFSAEFWLVFQGRFWTSTILHGLTMAFVGMFYAGVYLSSGIDSKYKKSPFLIFFKLPSFKNIFNIFSLHVVRSHLWGNNKTFLSRCTVQEVLLESLWLGIIMHSLFNTLLSYNQTVFALFLSLLGILFLKQKIKNIR